MGWSRRGSQTSSAGELQAGSVVLRVSERVLEFTLGRFVTCTP